MEQSSSRSTKNGGLTHVPYTNTSSYSYKRKLPCTNAQEASAFLSPSSKHSCDMENIVTPMVKLEKKKKKKNHPNISSFPQELIFFPSSQAF